jgi:hypothetical protein
MQMLYNDEDDWSIWERWVFRTSGHGAQGRAGSNPSAVLGGTYEERSHIERVPRNSAASKQERIEGL